MTLRGSKHVANLCNKLMCLTDIALLFEYFITHRDDFDQIHSRGHVNPPLSLVLNQLNPVHIHSPVPVRSILILCSHRRLCLLSDLNSSYFP